MSPRSRMTPPPRSKLQKDSARASLPGPDGPKIAVKMQVSRVSQTRAVGGRGKALPDDIRVPPFLDTSPQPHRRACVYAPPTPLLPTPQQSARPSPFLLFLCCSFRSGRSHAALRHVSESVPVLGPFFFLFSSFFFFSFPFLPAEEIKKKKKEARRRQSPRLLWDRGGAGWLESTGAVRASRRKRKKYAELVASATASGSRRLELESTGERI